MHQLIVDTENYSGNFEREMVAYATGCYGDCGVGDTEADMAREKLKHYAWWEENMVEQEDEDYGAEMMRPASICPTPGWFNNGRGYHFRADSEEAETIEGRYPAYLSVKMVVKQLPPQEVWDEFQERVIEFCEQYYPTMCSYKTEQPIVLTGVRQENAPTAKRKRNI